MIKLGIIGCGDVAFRTYFPGIEAAADRATLAACFDPLPERAERAAARFPGATAVESMAELLAFPDLDGVINLTPAPLHKGTTTAALAAGLHVLSEKPLAATVADGQALIAQAREAGRMLLCGPAVMATGRFRWLKTMLGDGPLGRPLLVAAQMVGMGPAEWKEYTGDPNVFYQPGVGPLIDIGVYSLHGMTGLLGPARRVEAIGGIGIPERSVTIPRLAGQTITVRTNDQMMLHLDFGENRFGQLLASFATPKSKNAAFEMHATGGSASIPIDWWYDGNGKTNLFLRDGSTSDTDWDEGRPLPGAWPDEHLISAGPRHFIDCLAERDQPVLSASHACHVLEIMLAAERSSREGRAIELETTL